MANEITEAANELKIEGKETTTELLSLFQAFNGYRKQWEEDAIRNYKLFIGHKEEAPEHRSNLHIPRTYQIIDTIRSRLVNTFFGRRPYIEFTPQPSGMAPDILNVAEDKAKVAAALVDEQLDKNQIVARYYDYITQLLIFPAGILGVGWRYEEKRLKRKLPQKEIDLNYLGQPHYTGNYVYMPVESTEPVWDDNEIKIIDFFDFWPDPKGTDLDDCRGVFQREFITYENLIQRLRFLDYLDEGQVYPVDFEEVMMEKPHDVGREKRMAEVGLSTSMPSSYFDAKDDSLKDKTKFEILHYWEDNRHAMIINRTHCVYDGPSPYWRHMKKPFVVESYDRLPNEFYGISAVDVFADLQEEENAIHNQRNDNINMIINKMWKIRRGADIDESDLVSRPHGVIHVDREDDVTMLKQDEVAASSFEQQSQVASAAEHSVGATPIVMGVEGRRQKTASEAMEMSSNAGQRFEVKSRVFNYTGIKRLAELMDLNNQQFIDGDRLVRIYPLESNSWRMASPGSLIGEYDYRPASPSQDPTVNKEVRREQLSQMMQFLMEAQVPFVKYHELVKEWLNSFDIEHAEKFILTEEEWAVVQQEQQAQMAMMEEEEGGQGPAGGQIEAGREGRARGRRPQSPRAPRQREGGNIR